MVFNHFANFFGNASIMRMFTLVFHMRKAIAVRALAKVNALVSRMMLKAPLTLFIVSFFIIPPIGKGIRGVLGLRAFLLRNFSGDVIDNQGGDVVVCISRSKPSCYFF